VSHNKISKAAALYFPAKILNQAGPETGIGAKCSKCMMYLSDTSQCMAVHADDNKKEFHVDGKIGVCGWMGPGKPMTSKDHKPMPVLPRAYAGYEEVAPTYCGVCRYYEGKRAGVDEVSTCSRVGLKSDPDGEAIEFGGCSNVWKPLSNLKKARSVGERNGLGRLVKIKVAKG